MVAVVLVVGFLLARHSAERECDWQRVACLVRCQTRVGFGQRISSVEIVVVAG